MAPSIKLWIHSAQDLKDKKNGSGIHPYVLCLMANQKQFRTQFQSGTDPTWEHGPETVDVGHSARLRLEVRDKDEVGARKLGLVYLSREECITGMSNAYKSLGQGRGSLKVSVVPVQGEPAYVKLEVTILSAKDLRKADLIGHSDPYVLCKLKDKEKFRTEVIWDEPNPVWNHGPEVILMHREKELRFDVYDKDQFRQGDHLGSAGVSRQVCLHGFHGHLDLGEGNGSLHVKIKPVDSSSEPAPSPPTGPSVTGKTVSGNVDPKLESWTASTSTKSEGPADGDSPSRIKGTKEFVDGAKKAASSMMSMMAAHLPKRSQTMIEQVEQTPR